MGYTKDDWEAGGDLTAGDDLVVTDDASIGGNLSVTGTLATTGATTFTGAVECDSTLGVDGNVRVGSAGASTTTVAAATGNTVVGGTLNVTGAVEADSTLGVDGDVRVGAAGASTATVTAATGDVDTAGDLTVDTINEHTTDAGVTVESVTLEDGNVTAASLELDSTNAMTLQIGGVGALQIDDAEISGFAAATDTAGQDVFVETQDAGGTPTGANDGGDFKLKSGDGSSAADATACGAGGSVTVYSGRGGENTGGATGEAGGDSGDVVLYANEGGDTNSDGAHNAGNGGQVQILGGVGGNATAGTGDGGSGGDIAVTPGTGGTSVGGNAGADGRVLCSGETAVYVGADDTGQNAVLVGPSKNEGLVTVVQEETVSPSAVETALTTNIPAGSLIRCVQANVEAALTGGGTTATWSVGTAADTDKYGTAGYPSAADSLAQNSKSNWIGAVQVTSAESIVLTGAATGGAADGDTALTVGSVRIVVVYDTYAALNDAP